MRREDIINTCVEHKHALIFAAGIATALIGKKTASEGVPSIKQVLPAEKSKGVRAILFVLLFTLLPRKV